MTHNQQLLKLKAIVSKQLDHECEQAFFNWKNSLMTTSQGSCAIASLNEKLQFFIDENRPAFYKNYQSRVFEMIDKKLSQIIDEKPMPSNNTDTNRVQSKNYKERRDRDFLEAYFINNECQRKTAEYLGIAKSTFHDWVKNNLALIESELKSRNYAKIMNDEISKQVTGASFEA